MRSGECRADCCRQGIAQATVSTWNDDGTPWTSGTELGRRKRCHRARVGNDHHITGRVLPESIDHALWCNRDIATRCSFSHLHPERRCPLLQFLCRPLTLLEGDSAAACHLQQCGKRLFQIATSCDCRRYVVAQHMWIDIDLKHCNGLSRCWNRALQGNERIDFRPEI